MTTLDFLGAEDTVTGSRSLVDPGGTRILVDCGLFHSDDAHERRNRQPWTLNPRTSTRSCLTYIMGGTFHALEWARIGADTVFLVLGVVPIVAATLLVVLRRSPRTLPVVQEAPPVNP